MAFLRGSKLECTDYVYICIVERCLRRHSILSNFLFEIVAYLDLTLKFWNNILPFPSRCYILGFSLYILNVSFIIKKTISWVIDTELETVFSVF